MSKHRFDTITRLTCPMVTHYQYLPLWDTGDRNRTCSAFSGQT